jgi:dipeptidyl aminopeptidase/acylaminoacyl peptidase
VIRKHLLIKEAVLKKITFLTMALVILFTACAPSKVLNSPIATTVYPTLAAPSVSVSTSTLLPPTAEAPTATIPSTFTPVPNPMSIAFLREGSYPGSDIVIVKELAAGSNYRRYYAYYLSEGLKIYALLTVPYGDPPAGGFPAIVFNHGYIPPDIYRTTERYIAYVDRLARSGYVVFRIDYRGNDKSEGVARGAYGDPGYTIDVLNAVASIKRYPPVNPEKIGMWGHSMGGFLTLRAMVISKDIKVGVIWSGVVASYPEMLYNWKRTGDFTPSPSSTGAGWRDGWIETYGTPEQNPAFWASVSANSYLADLSGPLQLHHGTGDEDVPLDFSIRLAEEIRAVGGTTELYTYENDNHNIAKFFNLAMDRTIEYFDHILKTQPS